MYETALYSPENPLSDELFSELFKILEYSFPENERRDFDDQLAKSKCPEFRTMTLSEDGKLLGFLNFWELSDFVYLEHFAVDKNLRGKGLGSELIRQLCAICTGKTIVLEAEPPELNEFSARRIEFYRRLGFHTNPFTYKQPPYRKGDEPVELVIMSRPTPLSESDFNEKIRAIYRKVYDC